jgi:predicted phage-related endonuclease
MKSNLHLHKMKSQTTEKQKIINAAWDALFKDTRVNAGPPPDESWLSAEEISNLRGAKVDSVRKVLAAEEKAGRVEKKKFISRVNGRIVGHFRPLTVGK